MQRSINSLNFYMENLDLLFLWYCPQLYHRITIPRVGRDLWRPSPALSACPHRTSIPSLGSCLWPSSGCTPTGLCLSCTEDSTSGRSTQQYIIAIASVRPRALYWVWIDRTDLFPISGKQDFRCHTIFPLGSWSEWFQVLLEQKATVPKHVHVSSPSSGWDQYWWLGSPSHWIFCCN